MGGGSPLYDAAGSASLGAVAAATRRRGCGPDARGTAREAPPSAVGHEGRRNGGRRPPSGQAGPMRRCSLMPDWAMKKAEAAQPEYGDVRPYCYIIYIL